jgi:hypothetical protein
VLFRSNLVYLSGMLLATGSLMFSCAWSAHPDQLTVHVPRHCSKLHLATCVPGASPADVTVDERGIGKTSLCPATDHSVQIEVIRIDHHYTVAAPAVHVQRTGDGLATSIEAELPSDSLDQQIH